MADDDRRVWRCTRCGYALGYVVAGVLRLAVDGGRWHRRCVTVRCPGCRERQRFDTRAPAA